MKVLVVRQPWAWLIVNGGKDIENRTWKTKHRGPLLIQASAGLPSKADMEVFRKYAARRGAKNMPEEFDRGAGFSICEWGEAGVGVFGRFGLRVGPTALEKRLLM